MEQRIRIDSTSVPWSWPAHLWPLYCAFAVRILRDFGEHRSILFTGLPEPAEGYGQAPTSDDLSSAYSALNDPEDVKKFGKFYTPVPVVSHVLRQLGYPETQDGPLLDPACGTGVFLVEATRRYLASNPEAKWEDLTREVRGIDIDPVAVLIARARVLEVALDAGLNVGRTPLRIDCRDALALDEAQAGTLFEGLGERKEELAGYVVGNPPYGKVHSSDARIAPYRDKVHGHANLYAIFLALAVGKLREGGRLGFVVPRSFASGLYFKNLRRHLLDELRFDEVTVFRSRNGVFSGVLQETLLLLARKGGTPGGTIIREPKDPTELDNCSRAVRVSASELSLGPRYDYSLVLSANPVAYQVLKRVRERSRPLAEHGLRASTGRLVWNRVKTHLREEPGSNTLRVFWPANVCRYVFDLELHEKTKPNYVLLNERTRGALSYPEDLVLIRKPVSWRR